MINLSEADRQHGGGSQAISQQEAELDFLDQCSLPTSLAGMEAEAGMRREGINLHELALRQPFASALLSETARLMLRHF